MGCCGSLTSSATGLPPINALPPEGLGQRYMQSGENVECWAGRTQSTDDKEGAAPPKGKIITASVAVACDLSFNQSIDAVPPDGGTTNSWDEPVWKPEPKPGITWNASGNNGKFTGKFDPSDENVEFELKITARFSDGTEDTKTYNFKPTKCNPDDDSITLINPFPTAQQTAPFGEVRPASGGGTRAHKGLDFGNGQRGGPIVAAADGKVIRVNSSDLNGGGYGLNVLIQHTNKAGKPLCNTFYAHLASVAVSNGSTVGKGQTIGQAGGSGKGSLNAYAIHLHFELHIAGKCKDPAPYIQPAAKVKTGSNSKPLWNGPEPSAVYGNSNYGVDPNPGQTTSGPDGYQTNTNPNDNAGKAINSGTVEMAAKQCDGAVEPPLNYNDPDTPVDPSNDPPCVNMLTLEQLQKSMPTGGNRCNVYLAGINKTIKTWVIADLTDKCGPDARKRVAMFLAQIGHETGDMRALSEQPSKYASSSSKWKGRGLMQLTGEGNYRAYAKAINRPDIIDNPDLVATDIDLACDSAGWWWKANKANKYTSDIGQSSRLVNRGNANSPKPALHMKSREQKWAQTKQVLQVA